jgi:hypothetical protein
MMGSAQGERKKVIEVKIQLPHQVEEEGHDIPPHVALQEAAAHLQMMELAIANGDVNGGWDWFKKASDAVKKGVKKVKDATTRSAHPEVVTVNLPKQFVEDTHNIAVMFDRMLTLVAMLAKSLPGMGGDDPDPGQEKRLGEIAQGVYRPRARQG